MKSAKTNILYVIASCCGLRTCHTSRTKKKRNVVPVPVHATLTMNGKSLPGVEASAVYMVVKRCPVPVNVTLCCDVQKEGWKSTCNRPFTLNAYDLQTESYSVVQTAGKQGTGGMVYSIVKNDQGN